MKLLFSVIFEVLESRILERAIVYLVNVQNSSILFKHFVRFRNFRSSGGLDFLEFLGFPNGPLRRKSCPQELHLVAP